MARTKLTHKQLASLVRNRQNSTTNAGAQSDVQLEIGWGFIVGTGASWATKAITFQTAFSAAPIIVISSAGYKDSSDPTTVSDTTGLWENLNLVAGTVTTTGFNAAFGTLDATTIATSRRILFTWIAVGS